MATGIYSGGSCKTSNQLVLLLVLPDSKTSTEDQHQTRNATVASMRCSGHSNGAKGNTNEHEHKQKHGGRRGEGGEHSTVGKASSRFLGWELGE